MGCRACYAGTVGLYAWADTEPVNDRKLYRRLRAAALSLGLSVAASAATATETSLVAPGAPEDLLEKLRGASAIAAAQQNELDTAQEFLAASLADYRTLLQVLYDEGYFSPVINIRIDGREASQIPRISPPQRVDGVAITVQAGPRFRFGTARVAPLAPDTELPDGFAPGQPAGTGVIRDAAIAAKDAWRDDGFAKADIGRQDITANNQTAVLDAQVEIIPGRQLRFGRLIVTGRSAVREAAIQRIAGIPSDKVFNLDDRGRIGDRLRRTGAFRSVAVTEAAQANPDGTLDMQVEVVDLPPRRITLGAEIQSQTGGELTAAWLHRNLFGGAQSFRIEGKVRNIGGSEDIDGALSIRLEDPARFGTDNTLFYLATLERIDRQHYTLERFEAGVGIRRIINPQLTFEASVLAETSRADDAFGIRDFDQVKFPLRGTLDKRDSDINATEGYFADLRLTPFLAFNGRSSGMMAQADGRAYVSLGERVVLAGRLQLGSVVGPSLSDTSPEFLFFSGGAGTVRGQPYESLGIPVGGDVSGGRSIAVASAEVRTRVTERISVVGFFDYGTVGSDSFLGYGSTYSDSGAGLGVRYDLGAIGPIRLDVAYPVSGSTSDGIQFYIGIGQSF